MCRSVCWSVRRRRLGLVQGDREHERMVEAPGKDTANSRRLEREVREQAAPFIFIELGDLEELAADSFALLGTVATTAVEPLGEEGCLLRVR